MCRKRNDLLSAEAFNSLGAGVNPFTVDTNSIQGGKVTDRFDFNMGHFPHTDKSENGKYVLFSDHEAEIATLKAEVTESKELCKQFGKIIDNAVTEQKALKAEVERLTNSLDRIANPIKWMQIDAEKEGLHIDGHWAVRLDESPNYLKGIARDAIKARGEV